jgi:drug/metabolite transporter (DMT)-like permease
LNHFKGVALVFAGAICFSIKAILIKLAYVTTVDAVTLLTLRMGFSLPFFLAVVVLYKRKETEQKADTKDWTKIVLLGILGYYLASIFDFWGLEHITAGLERLILFVYPTIVVLLSAFFLRKKITKTILFALGLTYLGIAIIFSDTNLHGSGNIGLGASFIFVSAFTYSAYLVGSGHLIQKVGSVLFNAYAMIVSCVVVLVHFAIAQPTNILALPAEMYYFGFAIAIISTVIPTFLVAEGIKQIGASKAAIVASIGPVVTIILGYFILHEPVTAIEIFGTIFVVGGVLLISSKK